MRYVTVAEMQELIDQCTGYSLDFVKCMTREVNILLVKKLEPVKPAKTIIGNVPDESCKT